MKNFNTATKSIFFVTVFLCIAFSVHAGRAEEEEAAKRLREKVASGGISVTPVDAVMER